MKSPTPDLVEYKLFRRKGDNMVTKPQEDTGFEIHPQSPPKWRIDHTVPLALVLTLIGSLVIQTIVGTWWISSFQTMTIQKLDNLDARQKLVELLPERMAKQEAQQTAMMLMLKDIKDDVRAFANRDPRK